MKKATKAAATKTAATPPTAAQKDLRNQLARDGRAAKKIDAPPVDVTSAEPLDADAPAAVEGPEVAAPAAVLVEAPAEVAAVDVVPAAERPRVKAVAVAPVAAVAPKIWQSRSGGRPPVLLASVLVNPAPGTAALIGSMVADYLRTHAVDPFKRQGSIDWMIEHSVIAAHAGSAELALVDGHAVTS